MRVLSFGSLKHRPLTLDACNNYARRACIFFGVLFLIAFALAVTEVTQHWELAAAICPDGLAYGPYDITHFDYWGTVPFASPHSKVVYQVFFGEIFRRVTRYGILLPLMLALLVRVLLPAYLYDRANRCPPSPETTPRPEPTSTEPSAST